MKLHSCWTKLSAIAIATALAGCATAQLNYNTMEIASTVESLQTRQILNNISKFIDDPDTIPDQIAIGSGNVSVTNSVTPNVSGTLSSTNVVAAARSTTRVVSQVLGASGSDQWTESWGISPISDGDALRRLRALYLFVANHDSSELHNYPQPLVSYTPPQPDQWPKCKAKWENRICDGPILVPDPFFQNRFHSVLVKGKPNDALCPEGWLYYTGPSLASGVQRPQPSSPPPISLGHFGNHDLFMTAEAIKRKCLSNFVLFILDAAGETTSPSGGGGGGAAGKPKTTIQLLPNTITPDQILPRQQ
jgi:hypothetical protein